MSAKTHHIVIVSSEFPPQPGGIGNHAYNLAQSLSEEGYSVEVITDQRSETGVTEENFDRDLPFEVHRIRRLSVRFLMYVNRIFKVRKCFKRASTVIATGKFSIWIVGFLSVFYKAKCIAVIHGTEVNLKSKLWQTTVELALKQFDHIIAVSHYTKSLVAHLKLQISVIPNGINIKTWISENQYKKTIKGSPVLTTVGRVSERKGQLTVINHLPELSKRFPGVHYHCIGIPQEADKFMSIARSLNVDHLVSFHGSLNNDDLRSVLKQTDIFVMLSAESKSGDVEGFGIAILEANALGVPAIGAINCGIEDAISDGNSGRLINSNNHAAFADAIDEIMKQKKSYSTKALQWAQSHDWSVIVKSYISQI